MPERYRFLLFDADLTLLDFPADMLEAFHAMYAQHFEAQRPFSQELLDCYNDCNNRAWARFERGECRKQELYIQRFVDFLAETGLSGDPEVINESYFTALAKTGAALPGALELVKRLSRDHELYMVTNGNVVSQLPRLEHSGLAPYFRDVFVSEAVGVGKPHREYFDYVMSHIPGFVPEEAIVIGDSRASDIQGAANAGLKSIWYCSRGCACEEERPLWTYRAESYEDILRILGAADV